MTLTETESKLKAIDKSIDDFQNAIRRMAQESNSVLTIVSKLSEDVAVLKSDVALLKREQQEKEKKALALGRTNY